MTRLLAVALLLSVLTMLVGLALADNDDDDHEHSSDNRRESSSENESKCPSQIASLPSYSKCVDAAPFRLGISGTVVSTAFCQSSDCYTFWSGLSSKQLTQCLPGYKIGGVAVANTNGMLDCFTNGGVLRPANASVNAPVPAPAPPPPPTPGNTGVAATSTPPANAGTTPVVNPVGTSPVSETISHTASSATGDAAAAGRTESMATTTTDKSTPSVAATSTTSSTTTTSNTSTSTQVRGQEGEVEEVFSFETGSGGIATRIVRRNKSPTAGGVDEEAVIDDETGSYTNSTTKGSRRSKSTGSGSQSSGSSDGEDDRRAGGSGASKVWVASGGSGVGLLAVVFFFLYFRKRRSSYAAAKKLDDPSDGDEYFPTLESSRSESDSISVLGASAISGRTLPSSRFAFWDDEVINAVRIPYEKLEIGALLSRGGYGEVYRGTYRDQPVAIKSLLPERRKDMRQIEKFITEVKLMAVLEHEHIVRFVGVAWDSLNELCVVSAFMAGGDLRSLLSRYEAHEHEYPKGFTPDKIKMAMHIAHALTYMHSLQPPILHRDLKSRNVLLDSELNAKVTDFGVSRERADSTMTIGVGSSLWMAPEVMTGGRYDEKADVFSFGVMLSELDTQTLPYAHALEPGTGRKLPDTVIVQMMTTGRIRVRFSDEATSAVAQLGRQCVALDPADRPTAAEVQHRIHQLWRHPSDTL